MRLHKRLSILVDTAGEFKKRKAEQYEREQRSKEFGTIEAMKDGKVILAVTRRKECLYNPTPLALCQKRPLVLLVQPIPRAISTCNCEMSLEASMRMKTS
jgi:hypothetical protein